MARRAVKHPLSPLALALLALPTLATAADAPLPCTTGLDREILLRWHPPADLEANPVDEYRLFLGRSPGVYDPLPAGTFPATASSPGAVLTGTLRLDPTVRWFLVLRAAGPGGESEPSNELSVEPSRRRCGRPLAPELLEPVLGSLTDAVQQLRQLIDEAR